MLAYKWGLKTVYYSLISKTGAKVMVTGTTQVNGSQNISTLPDTLSNQYDESDCESCKL